MDRLTKLLWDEELVIVGRFMMTFISGHWNLQFKEEAINPFADIKNNVMGYFKYAKFFLLMTHFPLGLI